MFNKKFIISLIILPLFILAGIAIYFLNQKQTAKIILPKAEESEQEKIISRQLKELEELRKRANIQPLTEEQKQAQLKELNALAKQAKLKPLSQAEIQKQIEELDKLRLAQ